METYLPPPGTPADPGRQVAALYEAHALGPWGVTRVYWSDQSGGNVVADIEVGTPGTQANGRYVSVAGRFSARGLTKLPLHFPGNITAVLNDLTMAAF